MGKLKLPIRVWILVLFIIFALLAIKPTPYATGVQVKSFDVGGDAALAGLEKGDIVLSLNEQDIFTVTEFMTELAKLQIDEQEIIIKTDKEEYTYNVTKNVGFEVNENLTILSVDIAPMQIKETVESINGIEVSNLSDFKATVIKLLPKKIVKIDTNNGKIAFLTRGMPNIIVGEASKSNLKKGLDLEGGTRVLLKPIAEDQEVTEKDIGDIIQVLSNRLNVYGLTDVRIRSSVDWSGEAFILIEIAGVSKEEVKDLIAQQGKFEAKIGNDTVFVGGKEDIPFVCRDDGSCSGVRNCWDQSGQSYCKFEFVIHISPDAAEKHANVTDKLKIISAEDGRDILSEHIDFYLDDKLVDSLQIGADLKGSKTTAIAISGSGVGQDRNSAIQAAVDNMNKLQTVLITGSLPFDLEIAKLDSISPLLGSHFIKNSLLVGLVALLAVALVIFIRYRSWKVLIPMILTSLSELIIILGFAALIEWNLDMAAIAGIIAAIGTGVDDQIVILDEVISGSKERHINWKKRIKSAFFIIFAAYSTTVAAMIPLWNAGAGLIRGFAITIIVGVTIGVFLTRPAFAAIIERLFKE
ncbi:MAG: hypothetical protein KKA65_01965 [Nanoarchaeota archaeon]|nr:hypothetical protein [Nanoarchaeota archaeon]MBU4456243.1 hypothetical protein [Nanoarchaeota archaeon]MCG2719380.1 hypothetical protein [Nanoarchaeota archaeon]